VEIVNIISSGLLELYAMGLASDAEVSQVADWAARYPDVKTELDAIEKTLETYAGIHAIEPGKGVKAQVLQSINSPAEIENFDNKPARLVSISPFWKYAAAASVVLLMGSAVFNFVYYSKYR
jgi:hypothetical protein